MSNVTGPQFWTNWPPTIERDDRFGLTVADEAQALAGATGTRDPTAVASSVTLGGFTMSLAEPISIVTSTAAVAGTGTIGATGVRAASERAASLGATSDIEGVGGAVIHVRTAEIDAAGAIASTPQRVLFRAAAARSIAVITAVGSGGIFAFIPGAKRTMLVAPPNPPSRLVKITAFLDGLAGGRSAQPIRGIAYDAQQNLLSWTEPVIIQPGAEGAWIDLAFDEPDALRQVSPIAPGGIYVGVQSGGAPGAAATVRGFGASDGLFGGLIATGDDFDSLPSATWSTSALAVPNQPVATGFTANGSLRAGTYYYRVTALSADGETTPSTARSVTIASTGRVALTWDPVAGAVGYRVYRGAASGSTCFVVQTRRAHVVDRGANQPAVGDPQAGAAPPGADTTAVVGDTTDADFELYVTWAQPNGVPDVPDLDLTRYGFASAETALAGSVVGGSDAASSCGWHGTSVDPERGPVAVVRAGGPLQDLVGERLLITNLDEDRSVTVYCIDSADVIEDISVSRRAYLALARASDDELAVTVEILS